MRVLRVVFGSAAFSVVILLIVSCGGGPAAPTSPSGSIEGTWHGTITFTKPAPITAQTTWTFTPVSLTSGTTYQAQASWSGITTRAMTATVIGSQFSSSGSYPSPLGCDGSAGGLGTADAHTIDATFSGSSSCDSVFEGHMVLTR